MNNIYTLKYKLTFIQPHRSELREYIFNAVTWVQSLNYICNELKLKSNFLQIYEFTAIHPVVVFSSINLMAVKITSSHSVHSLTHTRNSDPLAEIRRNDWNSFCIAANQSRFSTLFFGGRNIFGPFEDFEVFAFFAVLFQLRQLSTLFVRVSCKQNNAIICQQQTTTPTTILSR